MTGRRGGFTLIELLIALAILALVATLGYRAVASLTDSEAKLAAEGVHWRNLDALFARLEADARAAMPREARTDAGTEPAWIGGVARLRRCGNALFARRAGILLESGSGGQRIGYRLRNGAVEVLYWPYLDQPATVSPQAYALVGDVTRFRVTYLDARGDVARSLAGAGRARDAPRDPGRADARRRRSHRAMARACDEPDARRGDHPGDADRSAGRGRRGDGVCRPAALGPDRRAPPRSGAGAGARDGGRAMGAADPGRRRRRSQIDHLGEPWALALPPIPMEDGEIRGRDRRCAGTAQRQRARPRRRIGAGADAPCGALRATGRAGQRRLPSLSDWIDEDRAVRDAGAEDAFYLAQPVPHLAANGPCFALRNWAPSST